MRATQRQYIVLAAMKAGKMKLFTEHKKKKKKKGYTDRNVNQEIVRPLSFRDFFECLFPNVYFFRFYYVFISFISFMSHN